MMRTISYVPNAARDAARQTGMKDGIEQSDARLDGLVAVVSKER